MKVMFNRKEWLSGFISDFVLPGWCEMWGESGPSSLLSWKLIGTDPGGNVLGGMSYLPCGGVWATDHSRFQDNWVLSKGTFHFSGHDPVAGREKQTL